MNKLLLLLTLLAGTAYAVVNPTGKTHNVGNTVVCADGKRWTVCAPGNIPDGPAPTQDPYLAFSDLITGPDTGLGDGNGSGVIVTVWGQNLGSTQGSSTIQYRDSGGTARDGHVYYWKNADGTLPSGPANLYESHGMQEIAFSIPDSAVGAGTIEVTVDGDTSTLPFTVRAGSIYHVTPSGNDSTGDGSFANPWLTVGHADNTVPAGSTMYIHDVTTGNFTSTDMAIYTNLGTSDSSLAAQYSYISYPNTRPEAIGARGFNNYNGSKGFDGIVISKYSVFAAEADTDANDLPTGVRENVTFGIAGSKDGRAVGNYVTDEHPSDTNGACPDGQQAAITGNASSRDQISNWKVFGNQIHEYGCSGTNKQHHTTYFSIRSAEDNLQLVAPEVAYNYLKDNQASGGLHYFDENIGGTLCGDFTTTFKFHNNVVVDQVGPGIANYSKCPTTTAFEYYNNIVINAGVYPPNNSLLSSTKQLTNFQGVFIGQSTGAEASTSTLTFNNNIISGWNDSEQAGVVDSCIGFVASEGTLTINWDDNICITDKDKPFIQSNYQGTSLESRISGGGNVWYTSAGTQVNAVSPTWDATKITSDPLITQTGSKLSIGNGSPVINASSTTLPLDVYGTTRGASSNVGAVQ